MCDSVLAMCHWSRHGVVTESSVNNDNHEYEIEIKVVLIDNTECQGPSDPQGSHAQFSKHISSQDAARRKCSKKSQVPVALPS